MEFPCTIFILSSMAQTGTTPLVHENKIGLPLTVHKTKKVITLMVHKTRTCITPIIHETKTGITPMVHEPMSRRGTDYRGTGAVLIGRKVSFLAGPADGSRDEPRKPNRASKRGQDPRAEPRT